MSEATFDAIMAGKRLKELRKANGMPQENLATLLHVSVDSVYNYEKGKVSISHECIVTLCQHFDISADYFYFGYQTNLDRKNDVQIERFVVWLERLNREERDRAVGIMQLAFPQHTYNPLHKKQNKHCINIDLCNER